MSVYRRWGVLALLVLAPPTACAQEGDAASLVAQGTTARQAGRYDDAIRLAQRATARDSAHAGAARLLARALREVGR